MKWPRAKDTQSCVEAASLPLGKEGGGPQRAQVLKQGSGGGRSSIFKDGKCLEILLPDAVMLRVVRTSAVLDNDRLVVFYLALCCLQFGEGLDSLADWSKHLAPLLCGFCFAKDEYFLEPSCGIGSKAAVCRRRRFSTPSAMLLSHSVLLPTHM